MWWDICIRLCYKFPTESNSERILKIGQYLVKLWARVRCLVFFLTHSVVRCLFDQYMSVSSYFLDIGTGEPALRTACIIIRS